VSDWNKGAIAFMAKNAVAANLLMLGLIVGGLMIGTRVKQEVFPEFEMDLIRIDVAYPGASPEEIEKGIVLATEEAINGLDGIKKVSATALEGQSSVYAELLLGTDPDKALADIKNAVNRISSFPQEAERPEVQLMSSKRQVIDLFIHGQQDEESLRQLAEQLRDTLLSNKGITQVELQDVRPREISVEISQAQLRRYGLTLEQVAGIVRRSAIELPGGSVKTSQGEILLRTAERRDLAEEFENLPIVQGHGGSRVNLGDIAKVIDGFQDIERASLFNGRPAVRMKVFRVGSQTPITVSDAVHEVLDSMTSSLPPGIEINTWGDSSEAYRERVQLLLRNAAVGLVLVLLVLGMFLEIRLAFWVTMGIPISFLGSFFLLPAVDVSFNMISLFAYIITLGMVVDDAIVVGENIFEMRQRGIPYLEAAIRGAREVATPVTFSILTTIAAFTPMFFVPGFSGKLFRLIPAIVVAVLTISLLESLFVLPAHLAHQKKPKERGFFAAIRRFQSVFSNAMLWFINAIYQPTLNAAIKNRYLTISIGLAALLVTGGLIAGGRIDFTYFPKIESDIVSVYIEMPFGVTKSQMEEVQEKIVKDAKLVLNDLGGEEVNRGISTQLGSQPGARHRISDRGSAGAHLSAVQVSLVQSRDRDFTATEFAGLWRKKVGPLAGVKSLSYRSDTGPNAGADVDIQLSHRDVKTLESAADKLAGILNQYAGIKDIDNGFADGKIQIDFKIKPAAQSMGITATDIGRQIRGAFYGIEALRQQRKRDEVRVMVRLPKADRQSEYNIEELMLRSPSGGEIPLSQAAEIHRGLAHTKISRVDGRRILNVTAEVIPGMTTGNKIKAALLKDALQSLKSEFRGLEYSFEGANRQQQESLDSLFVGMLLALLAIYGLLAIPFASYTQPAIVMSAIPFGIVGAVAGHMIMGYELSIISMMGIVALTGVVVNDSLVLIDAANRYRRAGETHSAAIRKAAMRRFRPIWLTSLTTFFGLMPMITETSLQAKFLIPMAISLGFGVLFATVIILLIVPALYLVLEDIHWVIQSTSRWIFLDDDEEADINKERPPIPTPEDGRDPGTPSERLTGVDLARAKG
jgi:multidrug efflux pump subunit AcrB